MASSILTAKRPIQSAILPMEPTELDAARALLGVSPNGSVKSAAYMSSSDSGLRKNTYGESDYPVLPPASEQLSSPAADNGEVKVQRRPRSDSAGLDALAALASAEHKQDNVNNGFGNNDTEKDTEVPVLDFNSKTPLVTSASSSDDEQVLNYDGMPPPPGRRRRSASNPEGMEKWEAYNGSVGRRQFFLPESILEVELAEASAAVEREHQSRNIGSIPEDSELMCQEGDNDGEGSSENQRPEDEIDEKDLTPEELLRRARSRLLEDLSESNVNGEKGVLLFPHSLDKYKEVYNKNGRIGVYTQAERAAIIAKFKGKRTRRVWNKKIRYNCRKSLADRRLRVKGRFVKRSEQEELAKQLAAEKEAQEREENEGIDAAPSDEQMVDVDDPEAGFVPTEDQPYRRLRRYTIT